MDSWIALGKAADVPPGRGRTCVAGEHRIAVFNDGGEFLAVDDTCPHQGASLGSGAFHEAGDLPAPRLGLRSAQWRMPTRFPRARPGLPHAL